MQYFNSVIVYAFVCSSIKATVSVKQRKEVSDFKGSVLSQVLVVLGSCHNCIQLLGLQL